MPTKKESTAKTAKKTVKRSTAGAVKTKAASEIKKTASKKTDTDKPVKKASASKPKKAAETVKKTAAALQSEEAKAAPSIAKEEKKNTVRAQKAAAKTELEANKETVDAQYGKGSSVYKGVADNAGMPAESEEFKADKKTVSDDYAAGQKQYKDVAENASDIKDGTRVIEASPSPVKADPKDKGSVLKADAKAGTPLNETKKFKADRQTVSDSYAAGQDEYRDVAANAKDIAEGTREIKASPSPVKSAKNDGKTLKADAKAGTPLNETKKFKADRQKVSDNYASGQDEYKDVESNADQIKAGTREIKASPEPLQTDATGGKTLSDSAIVKEDIKTTAEEAKDGAAVFDDIEKIDKSLSKPKKAAKAVKLPEEPLNDTPLVKDDIKVIAKEADDGEEVFEAIEKLDEKENAPAKKAKAAKKTAAKKPAVKKTAKKAVEAEAEEKPAKKTAAKKTTKKAKAARTADLPEEPLNDTAAVKDDIQVIAKEADDGAKVFDDIAGIEASEAKQESTPEPAFTPVEALSDTPAVKADTKVIAKEAEDGAEVSEAIGKLEKEEEKKPVPEVNLTDEKISAYSQFPLETLLEMANALGLAKDLDTLKAELSSALDVDRYTLDSVIRTMESEAEMNFEDDGYDYSVVPYLFEVIYKDLPYKASSASDLERQIHDAKNLKLSDNGEANQKVYDQLMNLVRQILEVGQRQNLNTLSAVNEEIPGDLRGLITHFMDVAYDYLPFYSYDDVKFYEGFIFAVLSQFEDLADLQNRAMMDVADLYIKHGDYGRGDADYNYLLRENSLKDQIYYRFANVYRNFDPQKAKSIAASSQQFVDGRYEYYPKLQEILHS